jgi:DNA repair protein RecN (Recombination protein N)
MLVELHIEDLGVVERLDLVFDEGLTVLTGETGAGKTMLVEAISLLLGERSDPTRVRPGADEARVEGRFLLDGDELVLGRVVPIDGRSRAYVNGRLATASSLGEVGASLVELHGQHAHQRLLTAGAQRAALDRAAGVDLTDLRRARARLTEIDAALAALGGDARARAREIDLLRFQVDEIDAAEISDPSEDARLAQEEQLLADAAAHREAAAAAAAILLDDDGASDVVAAAVAWLAGRAALADHVERLRAVAVELRDAAMELRSAAEGIEEDPERLATVRERRQLLRDLCRKYGDDLAEVLRYRDEAARRLAELEGYEERAAALERERADAERAERAAARLVADARRHAAPGLAAAIEAHLRELALPHARVEIRVEGADPADEVSFHLAANPGLPLAPLARVASGGELARTMLALRLVLTEAPDTLVFDEVDAGIGGAAALAVARSLARLAERHQVLVVTHLPQVAAAADHQVVVTKHTDGSTTTSSATHVVGRERRAELARMLSGRADSESAQRHAAELLEHFAAERPGRDPRLQRRAR